jgi:hypothetical protein
VIFGFPGGLVLSAVKCSLGAKDWGSSIAGHGGDLDRLDLLSFSAPMFFHLVRYFPECSSAAPKPALRRSRPDFLIDQGLNADIAGLGSQYSADAQGLIVHATVALIQVAPLAFDPYVGFVDAPTIDRRARSAGTSRPRAGSLPAQTGAT